MTSRVGHNLFKLNGKIVERKNDGNRQRVEYCTTILGYSEHKKKNEIRENLKFS